MRQSYRYILAIFLFLISVNYAVDAQVIGGTLIFGRGGDSVGLDPAQEEDGESFKVCENIYDRLVQYKNESTEIEPALAESWEASEDGLTWRFNPPQRSKVPRWYAFQCGCSALFAQPSTRSKPPLS